MLEKVTVYQVTRKTMPYADASYECVTFHAFFRDPIEAKYVVANLESEHPNSVELKEIICAHDIESDTFYELKVLKDASFKAVVSDESFASFKKKKLREEALLKLTFEERSALGL